MKPGDVYVLKVNGETVVLIAEGLNEGITGWYVSRAVVMTGTQVEVTKEWHQALELETLHAHIDREFDELKYRNKLMSDYTKAHSTKLTDEEGSFVQ